MKIVFMLTGFLFMLCTACSSGANEVQKKLTIHGRLDDRLLLNYMVMYVPQNRSLLCKTLSFGAGGFVKRSKEFIYNVSGKNGRYAIDIPLGEVRNDTFCNWSASFISYSVNGEKIKGVKFRNAYRTFASFNGKKERKIKSVTYNCKVIDRDWSGFNTRIPSTKMLRCLSEHGVAHNEIDLTKIQNNIEVNFDLD